MAEAAQNCCRTVAMAQSGKVYARPNGYGISRTHNPHLVLNQGLPHIVQEETMVGRRLERLPRGGVAEVF